MKLNWFLHGVLMVEAGGGEGGGGGGGGDSTALAVSPGTEIAPSGDGTGDGTGAGAGTSLDTTGADSTPATIYEGGRVSRGVSQAFRKLETANPTLKRTFRQALDALDTVGRLRTMLGDKPFDKIKQLRKTEQEIATYAYVNAEGKRVDGMTAIRELNDDVRAHDTMYETANPLLIESMTETPLGKFAFTKLFPHVVAKYRSLAPKAYNKWFGGGVIGWLDKAEISIKGQDDKNLTEEIDLPRRMRRMIGCLPWTLDATTKTYSGGTVSPDQAATLAHDFMFIQAFLDRVRSYAAEQPEDLTPPKEDETAMQIAAANQKADVALDKAWRAAKAAECIPLLDTEIRKQTAALNLNATAIADITARARKAVDNRRNKQPDDMGRRAAFFKSRDMNGYLAYFRQAVVDYGPEAVTDAITASGHRANRKATAGKQASVAAAGAPGVQQQQAGAIRRITADEAAKLRSGGTRWMKPSGVGGNPGTTQDMVLKRQWMLKDGNPLKFPEGTIVQFP